VLLVYTRLVVVARLCAIDDADVPTFSRITVVSTHDILNDSHDATEEKTADRSAG